MKTAAFILVGVGTVGLVVTYALVRRKLEQLRAFKEEHD